MNCPRVAFAALVAGLLGFAPLPAQEPVEPRVETPLPGEPQVPEAAAAPAPAAATEVVAPAPPEPAPGPERITFELPVGEERGGGRITGVADRLETTAEEDAVLEGAVEVRWKDVTFRAERVVLHRATMTLEAEGDVVFDQGPRRIGAARVDFDLGTRTGTFWNASAYVEPDHYFTGDVIAKTGENDYEVTDGLFTSCTGDETPDWSLRTSRADVEIGGYAHVRNARVRLKKLPVLYWPYMIWPAKTDRTSGLLIPNVGYSKRRGAYLGLAYYQVMGPSADGTLYLDGYAEGFAGLGGELRWRPSEGSKGDVELYFLRDPDRDGEEWKANLRHSTDDLPWGLRGVVAYEDYSDYDFFREFERGERENTRRFLYSNAFLAGSWGPHSVNLLVDQRETFLLNGGTTTQRQLPELNYRLNKLKLGSSDLYVSLDSTASLLEAINEGLYDESYGRFDLEPELTYPLRLAPWMSVALSAGGRMTWWGQSVPVSRRDPETGEAALWCGDEQVVAGTFFCGDELDRVYPSAALDVVGPSFSKVFGDDAGRFGKYKHLIEPRWRWRYRGEFDEQESVPRFDEIDPFEATHFGEFALVNRVLAKPTDPEEGGASEILSFELSQSFSFDDEEPFQRSRDGSRTSSESPIRSILRVTPARELQIQAKAEWSTLFSGLESTSLSARTNFGEVDFDLTWFTNYQPELDTTTSDQIRLGTRFDIVPKRLRFTGQVNYDLESSELQQQRYFVTWTSQCWSAMVELREQTTNLYESRDYRFLLNLKNVGTFLDINSGESTDR
jgi:LPS-assembly protein